MCEEIIAEDIPWNEPGVIGWEGRTPPRIVILDKRLGEVGGYSGHYVVAIGCVMEDCYRLVTQHYPTMTKDQQILELSSIDEWGNNDEVCVNYVAYDAPGFTAVYAMWGLTDAGYDIPLMMDMYIAP